MYLSEKTTRILSVVDIVLKLILISFFCIIIIGQYFNLIKINVEITPVPRHLIASNQYKIIKQQWNNEESVQASQKSGFEKSRLFLGQIIAMREDLYFNASVTLVRYKDTNYFITSKHLFSGFEDTELAKVEIIIKIQGKTLRYTGDDVGLDSENDLAIIEAPDCIYTATDLVLTNDINIEAGSKVESFGFPGGNFFVSEGNILGMYKENNLEHSCPISFGSSGGPVVATVGDKNFLLGINKMFGNIKSINNISYYAVPSNVITKAIDELMKD